MNSTELIKRLKQLKIQTGSIACLGCGYEHDCSIRGCRIIREAVSAIESAEFAIDSMPTIDTAPVVHGHWKYGSAWYPPKCSNCKCVPMTPGYVGDVSFYERYFSSCPHCGAKMDEKG